ncbi:MAG: PDZ domain-containing protein [Gammaproteobacteria bacterium]|jgi:predicted metalloprotease with PDZ domain|nr:PDZ domain-containing protein [Gammaproteobacteria bacterium]
MQTAIGSDGAPNAETASAPLRYRVRVSSLESHLYQVVLQLGASSTSRRLSMPAWIPGSYLIRDFARHIVGIRAETRAGPVPLTKVDKLTWRLPPSDLMVDVTCEVYAYDLSVRSAYLDARRAYFNGTSLFLCVEGEEETPCVVEMEIPSGDAADRWTVATTLTPERVDDVGFGAYRATHYRDLIDHPVQWAPHVTADFDVLGVPHSLAICGHRPDVDTRRIACDLGAVCAEQAATFGGAPPPARYLFLVTAVVDGYGGLEHADSCSLLCARDDLPRCGETEPPDGYARFLGLCSHEYFHLWNVKRIRPAALDRPDLSREAYTTLLWFFEGATSYYDDLFLARSGRIAAAEYLELLAHSVTRHLRTPGRHRQSVAESSFDAWTKFYKPDENAPNAIVSYYLKGSLVALGLDVEVRRRTRDAATLDDVLRALWRRHGMDGQGLVEGDIERLVAEVCGEDLREFFDRYVYGREELPLHEWFHCLGVGLRLRAARSGSDEGGASEAEPAGTPAARPALGAKLRGGPDGVALIHVLEGSAAQRAGLSGGDVVVAVDGTRATVEGLERSIARATPGGPITIHAFRRNELMVFDVTGLTPAADTCDLWLLAPELINPLQTAMRDSWLRPQRVC